MALLLEVKDLRTEFRTGAGIVCAVDGLSYAVEQGETVAIVGESGSGKSVGALSILRLISDPPGRITRGEIFFAGRDLMQLSDEKMRGVRGGDIGMVFVRGHVPNKIHYGRAVPGSIPIIFHCCPVKLADLTE